MFQCSNLNQNCLSNKLSTSSKNLVSSQALHQQISCKERLVNEKSKVGLVQGQSAGENASQALNKIQQKDEKYLKVRPILVSELLPYSTQKLARQNYTPKLFTIPQQIKALQLAATKMMTRPNLVAQLRKTDKCNQN